MDGVTARNAYACLQGPLLSVRLRLWLLLDYGGGKIADGI